MNTEQQVNGNTQINDERNSLNQRISRLSWVGVVQSGVPEEGTEIFKR